MTMKKTLAALMIVTMLLTVLEAMAEGSVLTLPSGLKEICEGAFQNDTSIGRVVAPEGLEVIGANAFAGSSLSEINLPASLTAIDVTAFNGLENLTVTAPENTFAYDWAVAHGYIVPVEAPPYPESPHPYTNNMNRTWTYTWPVTVPALSVTFTPETELEEWVDYLYIVDGNGVQKEYTGTSLAGNTVILGGSSFSLRLCSDGNEVCYGFAISDIHALTQAEYDAWLDEQRAKAFHYETLDDGTLKLTAYDGPDSHVTVPGSVNGVPVTMIGASAFSDANAMTHLVVSEGIEIIDEYAFFSVPMLQQVSLPNTLRSLGFGAFQECANLTTVNLPAALTEIGDGIAPDHYDSVFDQCAKLSNVTAVPGTYAYVWAVYYGYIKDQTMAYPESAHPYAPGTQQTWYYATSASTPGLKITFSAQTRLAGDDVLTLTDSLGRRTDYAGDELAGQTVVAVGNAFQLTLSSEDGSDYGFAISSVSTMTQYEYNTWVQQSNAFVYETGPDGNMMLAEYRGVNTTVSVPSAYNGKPVTTIGSGAFNHVGWVTSLTLPSSVRTIQAFACAGMKRLERITLPNGLTTIGYAAFQDCVRLGLSSDIQLPGSLTSIGVQEGIGVENMMGDIFQGCENIGGVYAPMGSYAYNWAVYFGYLCPEVVEGLQVTPILSVGSLGDQNGTDVWDNLPGMGDWYIQFSVSAPQDWTVTWEEDNGFYGDEINGAVLSSDVHGVALVTMDNDTGAARDTTVTFTCGNETVTYILRQLPLLGEATLQAPLDLVEYMESYAEWEEYGDEEDMPYPPVYESVTLQWSAVEGATVYRLIIEESVVQEKAIQSGQTSVIMTLTAAALEPYKGETVEASLVAVDAYGYTYNVNTCDFEVYDPDRPPFDTVPLPDGTLKIVRYRGSDTDVTVPSEIDGTPVTVIGEQPFNANTRITGITLSEGITKIEVQAFNSCANLVTVNLPETLTEIGYDAFAFCHSLTSIHLPSSLTRIGISKGIGGENHACNVFDDSENFTTVTAEEGTYAYYWAVHYGYIQPTAQHLTVIPMATIGEVTTENGVNVWRNLPGASNWYIQFTVNAPGPWTATWDLDADIFASDDWDFEEPQPADAHALALYTMRNNTGAARDLTLTFTCGAETVTYILRQLPMPDALPTLVAPQALVDYREAYAQWEDNGCEGDEPEAPEFPVGNIDTVWTTTGAAQYEVQIEGVSLGLVHAATGAQTVTLTVTADMLQRFVGCTVELNMLVTDGYGYDYFVGGYYMNVND